MMTSFFLLVRLLYRNLRSVSKPRTSGVRSSFFGSCPLSEFIEFIEFMGFMGFIEFIEFIEFVGLKHSQESAVRSRRSMVDKRPGSDLHSSGLVLSSICFAITLIGY